MATNNQLISGSFWKDGNPFYATPFNATSGSAGIAYWNSGVPYSQVFNISPTVVEEEEADGYGNTVMGVASGNISTVMGIATANVSKVMGR